VSIRRAIMAKKKPVLTILQRMEDEAFRYPIADSNYGASGRVFCRWGEKCDDDESVWARLNREAGENG
jgi:hypothetical protein